MEGTHMDYNLTLAIALPFHNCSDAQVQSEFLGIRETILEKYKCSKFFKDMADYTNTFTTNNYKCKYYDITASILLLQMPITSTQKFAIYTSEA